MTARQLATACYAFGAVKWHDEDMVRSIAPSVIKQAPSLALFLAEILRRTLGGSKKTSSNPAAQTLTKGSVFKG